MTTLVDITGQRFGRLTVLGRAPGLLKHHRSWECRCDCGQIITHRLNRLLTGHSKSCGCLKSAPNLANATHNMRNTAEYRAYRNMLSRCYYRNTREYARYGGRGIAVCDRWREGFENFFADMGLKPTDQHSLDRIDNDGNYEPSNCRWATRSEQCRNRRSNVIIEYAGRSRSIIEWSEETGLSWATIHKRLRRGISPEGGLFDAKPQRG